jgi:phosphoserine phosphatase
MPSVSDAMVSIAMQELPKGRQSEILEPHVAADLYFEAESDAEADSFHAAILSALKGSPIDIIVQRVDRRQKRLLIADMDSTMIAQECIDELADFVGLKEQVAIITERAMRGELPFEPALRERVALLKGLDVGVIDTIIAEHITFTPGAQTLVQTMRAKGAYTALVSGGFTLFTGPIASKIGFHENRANRLVIDDNKLTGDVVEPILGKQAKRDALIDLRDTFSLTHADTLAIGDGANDLDMIKEAGLGVAFHAKPAVSAAASAWLDHSDLTALLYAQGYPMDSWVR